MAVLVLLAKAAGVCCAFTVVAVLVPPGAEERGVSVGPICSMRSIIHRAHSGMSAGATPARAHCAGLQGSELPGPAKLQLVEQWSTGLQSTHWTLAHLWLGQIVARLLVLWLHPSLLQCWSSRYPLDARPGPDAWRLRDSTQRRTGTLAESVLARL